MRHLTHKPFVRASLWLLVGWVVIFWRLGYLGLLDPDEAHYAQLTREMMRSNSWFVPLLDGTPFIDKPVFFHWLQAASIRVLGDSELALRVPSALAAAALVAVVWWSARRLLSATLAESAAAMFITLPATFALSSVGLFDMAFAASLFVGVASVTIGAFDGRVRLQYAGFVALAFAVLMKGPVAVVLVGAFAATSFCFAQTRPFLSNVRWGTGVLLVLCTTLPWFAWMAMSFGDRFVRDYVLAGNLWYLTAPQQFSTRTSDWFFYGRTFLGAFFPWSLIAVAGGIDDLRARRRGVLPSAPMTVLWLWVAVILVFFSIAGFKLDTYIYPAAPACALLAAVAWQRAATQDSRIVTRAVVGLIALLLVAGGLVSAVALLEIDLGIGASVTALPAVFVIGGALLAYQWRRTGWRLLPPRPFVLVGTLVIAFATVVEIGFPVLESSRPTRILGRWIARHTDENTSIGSYGLEDWRASIRYYSNRRVTRLGNAADVNAFLAADDEAQVLMLSTDYDELRHDGLDVTAVAAERAIVGRTGKVFRRQIWGQLVVVTRTANAALLARAALE